MSAHTSQPQISLQRRRWLVRHIWRAFPELDPFTDQECRAFVQAARKMRLLTVVRAVLLVAAPVTAAVGVLVALPAVSALVFRGAKGSFLTGSAAHFVIVLVGMAIAGVVPPALCLALRDWLLQHRLRTVLDVGGRCPRCRYSLVGLVIPESLHIPCPECGMECRVDGSLTELSRRADSEGTGTTLVVAKEHSGYWTRERARQWLRRGAVAMAVLLAPMLVYAGVIEYSAHSQAWKAAADMPAPADLTAVLAAGRPGATLTATPLVMQVCCEAGGDLLQELPATQATAVFQAPAPPFFAGVLPDLNADVVEPHTDQYDYQREMQNQRVERAKRYLAAADAAGVFPALKKRIEQLPYEVRDTRQPVETLISQSLPYARYVHDLCAALCARARMAISQRDTAKAEESLTLALLLCNRMAEQPLAFEAREAANNRHDVRVTLQRWLMSAPSSEEVDAVERVMHVPDPRGDPLMHTAVAELCARAALAEAYQDVAASRRVAWGGAVQPVGSLRGWQPIERPGTWEDNRSALTSMRHAIRDIAKAPRADRMKVLSTWINTPAGQAVIGLSGAMFARSCYPYCGISLESPEHDDFTDCATINTMVVLERWRLQHGSYPDALEQLVPSLLTAVPVDPWSNLPMGYRWLDRRADAMDPPYLLYSHGFVQETGEGPKWNPARPLGDRKHAGWLGSPNCILNFHTAIPRTAKQPAP